ncbi:uncharacterized protein LOC111372661 [Olea europaea var. sylvestris]|uniref:uncharacterized protein LOC111372661 n=1 Tax=Olea europaea var. sylvestris TaxID=158386 RepID=UPI000C1CDCA7|nr:uncharacterized protein LOC111372661 [Olea europaea var. sylvestris]
MSADDYRLCIYLACAASLQQLFLLIVLDISWLWLDGVSKDHNGLQELVVSVGALEFSGGRAEIAEVTRCTGDAFLVTVRNKKRVGYNYELTLRVNGEWTVGSERRKVKGHIDIPEFSLGELDDLQIQAKLSEDEDLLEQDKRRIIEDLKLFLQPLRGKLHQFEQELKDR